MSLSRRSFLATTPLAAGASFLLGSRVVLAQSPPAPTPAALPADARASFPTQPPDLAREMVGASHANLARVKELLALHPTLAKASWDWGFGDWEDALGAASHVGNRDIAILLIEHGARPTIFSAAMLGQLDVVKAFIAAAPGVEATHGPHSLTLMSHAMAGGAQAEPVVAYLKALPGADRRPDVQPITADEMSTLTGEYVYGAGAAERIAVTVANGFLQFTRSGRSARRLGHKGDRAFFPVGAPAVRIRFRETADGMLLSVHDPGLVLEARRTR